MDSGVVGYRREGRSALLPPRRSKTRAGACAHTGVHACQELGCSGTPKKRRRSRRIRYSSLRPDKGEKLGHWSPEWQAGGGGDDFLVSVWMPAAGATAQVTSELTFFLP